MTESFQIQSFPKAIIHVDGDSFFASCEQATNPKLKGKPVVTGKERGIVSAASYEAKALGITRAMKLYEVEKRFPEVVILPSDYELYSLISERMFSIVRRYTGSVEEYGIDECFAEITGMRRPLKMSYEDIALCIKKDLEHELGQTFSIGLAPTKVLAKLGSNYRKPSGYVVIPGKDIHKFLNDIPTQKVWGIGKQTSSYLDQLKIKTALQFAQKEEWWVKQYLSKPYYELWHELRGNSVLSLETAHKRDYKSISKTKTFTPASRDRSHLLSQLSKNAENACIKARRYSLEATRFYFFIKNQEFRARGYEVTLSRPTAVPNEIMSLITEHFDEVFDNTKLYRSTGVVLAGLQEAGKGQIDLFGESLKAEKLSEIFSSIDKIDKKFGKHTVFLGTSFEALHGKQFEGDRSEQSARKSELFKEENSRQRVGLPYIGSVT